MKPVVKVHTVFCAKGKKAVEVKGLKPVRRMRGENENDNTTTVCVVDKRKIDMT